MFRKILWCCLSHFLALFTYIKYQGNKRSDEIVAEDTIQVWVVWLDERAKIASFHQVEGYRQQEFSNREYFHSYMMSLQERGFRFQ